MKISATVKNSFNSHQALVNTQGNQKQLSIEHKASGYGSNVNGGELLMLAMATCFCNDIYREAAKQNIEVTAVEVTVTGNFGAEGEAGSNFSYSAKVASPADMATIDELIKHTDTVAEIQNTLRKGAEVKLVL